MGYDLHRFESEVDEELICPICSEVLQDPVQAPACEHAFCSGCINEWLTRQGTCPVDRQTISLPQLRQVPRILRNLLSRLTMKCNNAEFGCPAVVRLDALSHHLEVCEHNPKKPVYCALGCGLAVPLEHINSHNCMKELHSLIQKQNDQVVALQEQQRDILQRLVEQEREVYLLNDIIRSFRLSASSLPVHNPSPRSFADSTDEVQQWLHSLQPARVTRWGGMISTPDLVLQTVIRRSLGDSGCPASILDELMQKTHERQWPTGLSTLETRQLNRCRYEQYFARRVPGKQAIVVMACENRHVSGVMVAEPGLVMIFAHGIE